MVVSSTARSSNLEITPLADPATTSRPWPQFSKPLIFKRFDAECAFSCHWAMASLRWTGINGFAIQQCMFEIVVWTDDSAEGYKIITGTLNNLEGISNFVFTFLFFYSVKKNIDIFKLCNKEYKITKIIQNPVYLNVISVDQKSFFLYAFCFGNLHWS